MAANKKRGEKEADKKKTEEEKTFGETEKDEFEDIQHENDNQKISKETPDNLSIDIEPITTHHSNYSDIIGTGKHAKTNIIWYIISSILVIFSCICISLFILVFYNYKISEVSQSIKDIWSVFTPIITLSLGYLFGKKTNSTKK